MELDFTEDQEELRDGVRTMLAGECPMTFVRAIVEDGAPVEPLWQQMVELGWPALTVPEEFGGLGLGAVELAIVAEEMGRAVAPGPLLPTASQLIPALRELGSAEQQAHFLRGIAEGTVTGSLALHEPGHGIGLAGFATTATETGDGVRLDGMKEYVLEGAAVTDLVVLARLAGSDADDAVAACLVPTADVRIEPVTPFDATRGLARVHLDGVAVAADRVLGTPGTITALGVERVLQEAATATAAESVGTCQAIFDITLDYAKQREQFGVPIGSFQAIKHKFADLIVALEKARASTYFAALTIAEDDERRAIATSAAKVAAADCERMMSKEGIQIHGSIGYTWEHDMHLYIRRAKTDSLLFGTAAEHRERIARLLGL
ncbi:MAG: acyl-CoA dehydrogenase [Actinobacteria bacterium]|nr:acyl-CoA dehydrogenase [Actinomycetota bacterium]